MIPAKDPNQLICTFCGSTFPLNLNDTIIEQGVKSDIPTANQNQTKIISARNKRKHYDNFGSLISEDDQIAINESLGAGFKN